MFVDRTLILQYEQSRTQPFLLFHMFCIRLPTCAVHMVYNFSLIFMVSFINETVYKWRTRTLNDKIASK